MPTCGRCVKRNKSNQCVYHPAPLTKGPFSQDSNSDQSSPRVNSLSTLYRSPSNHGLDRDSIYPEPKRLKLMGTLQSITSPDSSSRHIEPQYQRRCEELRKPVSESNVRSDALGFDNKAGFINHSAVLTEHELSIGIQAPNINTTPDPRISQLQIDRGSAILTLFNELPTIEKYIDK
jgi:hypothetical protein